MFENDVVAMDHNHLINDVHFELTIGLLLFKTRYAMKYKLCRPTMCLMRVAI